MLLWRATLFALSFLPLSTLPTRELRSEVCIREHVSGFSFSELRFLFWGQLDSQVTPGWPGVSDNSTQYQSSGEHFPARVPGQTPDKGRIGLWVVLRLH